jgi:hypothetical protein
MDELAPYLAVTEAIDWQHPAVLQQAASLAQGRSSAIEIAQACFEWVRDRIHHSYDYQLNPITWRASDVLQFKTGYCYAKSHLLAALLRANHIPAGLCYQRLSLNDDGAPYCLHGLNAVYLPQFGWYRVDARGNRSGVDAQFCPPQEQLAFALNLPGEADFSAVFEEPLPLVLAALKAYDTWDGLLDGLPDISLEEASDHGWLVAESS